MKKILELTTIEDLQDWSDYFLVVDSIDPDPVTGLDRVAIVRNMHIDQEDTSVLINTVIYLLDENGAPINGRYIKEQKNIIPIEVAVTANNLSYVNLQTMQVITQETLDTLEEGVDYLLPEDCETITSLAGLPVGVGYLPEFEAYRIIAKSSPIDLFALMTNAIVQSTKI